METFRVKVEIKVRDSGMRSWVRVRLKGSICPHCFRKYYIDVQILDHR